MAGRIVRLDTSIHQTAQELLPWFVVDALNTDEATLVREHVRVCTQCRLDMERQRELYAALSKADAMQEPEPDAGQAFARLSMRLAPPRRALLDRLGLGALWPSQPLPAWIGWSMAVQTTMIAGLILALILPVPQEDARPSYRGLGAPENPNGNVIVMFIPETTEQELRQILRDNEARIVDGPATTGAYVLHVPDAQRAQAIASLRSAPGIRLAQPLDNGGSR